LLILDGVLFLKDYLGEQEIATKKRLNIQAYLSWFSWLALFRHLFRDYVRYAGFKTIS